MKRSNGMHRTTVTLLVGASLLALSCVRAPERTVPDLKVDVPDRFGESQRVEARSSGATGPEWWAGFDDPSLTAVIEAALESNVDLVAAAARVEGARAQARIASASLKPSVQAGGGADRGRTVFVGFPFPGGDVLSTTVTRYAVSLDTSWEADLWGRLRAGARAALADTQAIEAELAAARLSVAGQTAKTWFAAAAAQEQIELARASAASFRALAEQIRARYEAGTRPSVDLRLARSNAAEAEAVLANRQRALDLTLRSLEVLLGRYPGATLLDEFPIEALPNFDNEVPTGLPVELVVRRPDLVAAERRLVAQDQRYVQSRKALLPRLTLTGSGGTTSDELSELLDGDFRTWSLVGGLVAPLFQGGRLRADVKAQAAGVDAALAAYTGAVLNALSEVETSLAAERTLAAELEAQLEAVTQLEAARRVAEDRYRRGVGDYLTVLESQTRAFAARSRLISLERQRLDNRVNLHLALGGGYDSTEVATTDVAGAAR